MRKIIAVILLCFMAFNIAGTAHAQDKEKSKSRKELKKEKHEKKIAARRTKADEKARHKEEKKKEKRDRKKQKREQRKLKKKNGEPVAGTETQKKSPRYPASRMKPRYRIDVLAMIYLDDVKNYKIPDKALPGIAFYEGVNIAADSLKKAGFKIDIYVHDVASANESVETLLQKNMLDSSDLVIGAVQARDVPMLAEFARKKQINFISALSPSDGGIKDNQYFTLLQPSLSTHCDWITGDVARKFPGMKVDVLYRTSSAADSNAYRHVMEAGNAANYKPLLCNTLPRRSDLMTLFDTARPNVLIVPVLDFSYADSLLTRISHDFPGTHFEVYGMPSWNTISNLRREEAFPNMSISVTMPFNIDASGPVAQYVSGIYKRDYGGKASEFVYRGYEATFWYANLLRQYGTIFNEKYGDNTKAPFTKFQVAPHWDKDGQMLFNENTLIFVARYEGGAYKTE